MKIGPEHTPLVAIGAVALLGAAGLGYFAYSQSSSLSEQTLQYEAQVQKLQTLQSRKPYPSEENLTEAQKAFEAYKAEVETLQKEVAKRQLALKEVTPQEFQDRLRKVVSEVEAKAKEQGVQLPDGFYLGFEEYRTNLPPQELTSQLARQLDVISELVNRLIDLRVSGISSIVRTPLSTGGGEGERQGGRGGSREASTASSIAKQPFDITFTGEQGKFRQLFNGLINTDQFLIVRALKLQNSNPQGPPRKTATSETENAPAMTTIPGLEPEENSTPSGPQRHLSIIVGREIVEATLRIEIATLNSKFAENKQTAQ